MHFFGSAVAYLLSGELLTGGVMALIEPAINNRLLLPRAAAPLPDMGAGMEGNQPFTSGITAAKPWCWPIKARPAFAQ